MIKNHIQSSKFFTAAVAALALLLAAARTHSQTLEERVDRYIASFPRHEEFHGVVFAAAGGHILLNKGYGLASREFNIPHSPGSTFQVGSISKAFTAVLVLKMVESGKLKLDRTISDYLPFYPSAAGNEITIHHLLSHTSGILHHHIAIPDYWTRHDKVYHTPRQLLSLFATIPLAHNPGDKITYSSPGFYILGAILERVAQKSYSELLSEHILKPLKMNDTYVENNRTVRNLTATGYMRGLAGLIRAGFEDKSTALAAGDLVSTAQDLYLWDRGMRAGKILSPASLDVLRKPVGPGTVFTYGGPLLTVPYDNGRKTLTINRLSGSSTGYSAAMDRLFDLDACTVILSNVQDAETVRILDNISDFLTRHELSVPIGIPAPLTLEPPPAVEIGPDEIRKVLGFYLKPDGAVAGVVRGGNGIYLLNWSGRAISSPILELIPEGKDSFNLGWLPEFKCRFSHDEKDSRLVLTTTRGGRTVATAKKIAPAPFDGIDYEGFYTSVELQKTFLFSRDRSGVTGKKFLGSRDIRLFHLDKDLFGYEGGFLSFNRNPDGSVSGFKLMTYDVDIYFGSLFVKI